VVKIIEFRFIRRWQAERCLPLVLNWACLIGVSDMTFVSDIIDTFHGPSRGRPFTSSHVDFIQSSHLTSTFNLMKLTFESSSSRRPFADLS